MDRWRLSSAVGNSEPAALERYRLVAAAFECRPQAPDSLPLESDFDHASAGSSVVVYLALRPCRDEISCVL